MPIINETIRSIHRTGLRNSIRGGSGVRLVRRFDARKHSYQSGIENGWRMAHDRTHVARSWRARLAPASSRPEASYGADSPAGLAHFPDSNSFHTWRAKEKSRTSSTAFFFSLPRRSGKFSISASFI